MSAPKIRCGVVGVGSLGQHHARIYASLPGAELVGLYDTSVARASEISEKFGCRRFGSIGELAAVCDAVSVVVPTDLHEKVALPLLAAGCHLLIEKPICASLEEAERVLLAAKARNCLVQVGHVEHFNPVMAFLEKEASRPQYLTAERLAPYQVRGTEVGVVLDLMIHDIGIVLALVKSPIARIDSVGISVLSKTEDIANARIQFENGCVANLTASRISPEKMRKIRVFQREGYVSLDYQNQTGEIYRLTGGRIVREEVEIDKDEPLKRELAAFVECARQGKQPKVSGYEGAAALELAVEITRRIDAHAATIEQRAQQAKQA